MIPRLLLCSRPTRTRCVSRLVQACGQLALILITALLTAPASAQPATGTIQGRVRNAESGTYLSKALVTIIGTNVETLTNEFGEFTLYNVAAGEVQLKASYTGQAPVTATVNVTAGETTTKDFDFIGKDVKRNADGTLVLDPFTVAADRFRNAREIAINEERNSVNIKNVVAIDQFGDIPSGNIGEFVKFLPGVQVSYGAFGGNSQGYAESDASGISIRGFGPEDTAVLIDGMPVSNATPGSLSRQVALDQLSVNNASRVELIKVATPDMPNNSIGGQVNLITKSSFEYAQPTYSGRVFFNFNSMDPDLKKTPGPVKGSTFKTTPGLEFTVTQPFSRTLGIAFTGYAAREYKNNYRVLPTFAYTGTYSNLAGQQISLANPALSRFQIQATPMMVDKVSGNLRVDWKPSPSQSIRANVQYSTYDSVEAQRNLDVRPTMAAGADWSATKSIGTTANSTASMVVRTRDKVGNTRSAQLAYDLNLAGWKIAAKGSYSVSESDFRDRQNGHFSEVAVRLNPGAVHLEDIRNGVPGKITTYERGNPATTVKDYTQIRSYTFDGTIAQSGEAFSKNSVGLYAVDVERDLSFLPLIGSNSLSLKMGARRDQDKTEKSGIGTGYREVLAAGKSYLISDIFDDTYVGQSPGFGLPAQQWASTYKLFELDQKNDLFVAPEDGADAINNYNSYVNQQKQMTDTKDAFYAMLSGSFFNNRLYIVAGARQETSTRVGRGPYTDARWDYAKTPDGRIYLDNFYRTGVKLTATNSIRTNADGTTTTITNFLSDSALLSRMTTAGVKYPDHILGPNNTSLESRKLNLQPLREVDTKYKGDPSFSFNTQFKLTSKLDLKIAYSRSFKLPDLENSTQGLVSGNNSFVVNEAVPVAADGTRGTISVANPQIKPETSQNWDFEISYRLGESGQISLAGYHKSVTNQVVTFSSFDDSPVFHTVLPILGLDPADYEDWRLTTSSNSKSKQATKGLEFQVIHDLSFLGRWGRNFQGFVTFSAKELAKPAAAEPVTLTSPNGNPVTFTPSVKTITLTANRFGGAGLQYIGRRFYAQLRATYRNDNELSGQIVLADGNVIRRIAPAETRVDLNLNYILSKRYNLFLSGKDILYSERKIEWHDDKGILPSYAQVIDWREFGVTWTVGLNARF